MSKKRSGEAPGAESQSGAGSGGSSMDIFKFDGLNIKKITINQERKPMVTFQAKLPPQDNFPLALRNALTTFEIPCETIQSDVNLDDLKHATGRNRRSLQRMPIEESQNNGSSSRHRA